MKALIALCLSIVLLGSGAKESTANNNYIAETQQSKIETEASTTTNSKEIKEASTITNVKTMTTASTTTSLKASTKKATKATQTKGLKKGNIKLNGEIGTSTQETYYVYSNAVFENGRVKYLDNDNPTASVTIWDEGHNLIETIPNAVTKAYSQEIRGDEPVEIGLLSEQKEEMDANFFGWYQPLHKKWLLSCKYSEIEILNKKIVITYADQKDLTKSVQVYDLSSKKCYKTVGSGRLHTPTVYSYGKYYWIYNGINRYEIYNSKFQWVRTVKYDNSVIYYEDGTIRVKKEKVLKALKIKNPKTACLYMKSLCWPKADATALCNIAPNDDCGYQETEDYIITKKYKAVYYQNIAGEDIDQQGDYYVCGCDGDVLGCKVYDKKGNKIVSENEVAANGILTMDGTTYFYGYEENGTLSFFDKKGRETAAFEFDEKNSFFQRFYWQPGNIIVRIDHSYCNVNIMSENDQLILSHHFEQSLNDPNVMILRRKDGDFAVGIDQRLIFITEDGHLKSDVTLDAKKDGILLALADDGYITSCKGEITFHKVIHVS